jgi:hypothetical protein
MELRTEVDKINRPALLRREALHPERCLSTEEIKGRQSETLSLLGGEWKAEISLGKGGNGGAKCRSKVKSQRFGHINGGGT